MSGETKLGIRMVRSMRLLYLLRQVLKVWRLLMKLLMGLLLMLHNLRLLMIIIIISKCLLLGKLLKWRSRSNSMRRRSLSGLYGLRDGGRY